MRGRNERKRNDLSEADGFHRFKKARDLDVVPKIALGRGQTVSLEGKWFQRNSFGVSEDANDAPESQPRG